MHLNGKALVVAMLVTCSGCGNADVSNARRDYILAGDHGWIDLTVNSLAQQDKDKEGKIDNIKMRGISEEIDLSYDFQYLYFIPSNK